jgi:hypothetical protein
MNVITNLVYTAKLEVHIEVLLVQRLQARIEQGAHQGGLGRLDDVCTGMLGRASSGERVEPAC